MLATVAVGERQPIGASETADADSWHIVSKESFGDRLRRYRRLRGLSQAELATKSGTDKGQIGKMETTPTYEPTRDVVRRLAKALAIQPWQLEDEDFRPSSAAWRDLLMADDSLDEDAKDFIDRAARMAFERIARERAPEKPAAEPRRRKAI